MTGHLTSGLGLPNRTPSRRELLAAIGGVALAVLLDAGDAWGAKRTGVNRTKLPGGPIPNETLTRLASQYNGTYNALWADSGGGQGSGRATFRIDAKRRKAELHLAGRILGKSGLRSATHTVGLSDYGYDQRKANGDSAQLGSVRFTRIGFGQVQIESTNIPGGGSVERLDVFGILNEPTLLRFDYTITRKGAKPINGALDAAPVGRPLTRPTPAPDTVPVVDIATGRYASTFVTEGEASKAFGEAAKASVRNGGRIGFQPGLDISNCLVRAKSGAWTLELSIVRAVMPGPAALYWARSRIGRQAVPGHETAAFFSSTNSAWVLGGNEVAQIEVNGPSGSTTGALPIVQRFVDVIAPKLGKR